MRRRVNRWIIFTCTILIALMALQHYGLLEKVISMDKTYISLVIISLFVLIHFTILKLAFNYSFKLEQRFWVLASSLTDLGMIGTVAGFIIAFSEGFSNLDVSNPESIAPVIESMATGLGTALMTTLVAVVCFVIAKVEIAFIIGFRSEEDGNS